jgi:hypothetical protein
MWNVTDAMACASLLDVDKAAYCFEQATIKFASKLQVRNALKWGFYRVV